MLRKVQPQSIIPHGVPLKQGFPGKDHIKQLLKSEKPTVGRISRFLVDELAELSYEEDKMSPKMNIEKVLKIRMPKHTKLLYGDNNQRFERNPDTADNLVSMMLTMAMVGILYL